jgi:hypothetical protein
MDGSHPQADNDKKFYNSIIIQLTIVVLCLGLFVGTVDHRRVRLSTWGADRMSELPTSQKKPSIVVYKPHNPN